MPNNGFKKNHKSLATGTAIFFTIIKLLAHQPSDIAAKDMPSISNLLKGEISDMTSASTNISISTPQITTAKTSGGAAVVHQEISKIPVVAIYVFARGGLLYENNEVKNKRGITYLMQSLITKGTATRTSKEISDEAERIGGAISASTDKDYALVEMTVAKENFSKAMELIADVIKNPTFPDEEFAREKEAALAAIQTRKDRISTIADDLSNLNFYGSDHPYSLPETGTLKTMGAIKRKDIILWHKKIYSNPANLVISIAGDIDLKTALEESEKNFNIAHPSPDGKSDMTLPPPPEPYDKPPAIKSKKVEERHDFKQAYLMISYPAPPPGGEGNNFGYPELKFLSGALGSRMSGRLFKELREKRSLAYEVNAYYPTRARDARFTIYIGLDQSNLPTARREIARIINDIKSDGLSDEEIEETRRFLKGIWTLKRQTRSSRAFFNGYWTILGEEPSSDIKYINRILSVTKENIISAARRYLDDAKSVEVTITPKSKK